MNTAIPTLQTTYVCETCDFPDFGRTEHTLGLRLRLDSACRSARQPNARVWQKGGLSLGKPRCLGVFLPVKGIKVWVNHGFENAGVWHCATVAGNSVGAVLLAVDKALDRHLVGAERDGGRSCFLEDLLLVEQNLPVKSGLARPTW